MGVKTFAEAKKEEPVGIAFAGRPPEKVVNPEAVRVFQFPSPIMGESTVSLDVGDVDKEKNPVFTQLKLEDGCFTIPKEWDDQKRIRYRDAFLKAGFEETDFVEGKPRRKRGPAKKYKYFAGHPDNTKTKKVEGEVAFEFGGKEMQLELVNGVIETEDKKFYAYLLDSGYYEAKKPVEIKKD